MNKSAKSIIDRMVMSGHDWVAGRHMGWLRCRACGYHADITIDGLDIPRCPKKKESWLD